MPSTSISSPSPPLRIEWLIKRFGDLAADITLELNNGHEDE
jgi:hypothetical protein